MVRMLLVCIFTRTIYNNKWKVPFLHGPSKVWHYIDTNKCHKLHFKIENNRMGGGSIYNTKFTAVSTSVCTCKYPLYPPRGPSKTVWLSYLWVVLLVYFKYLSWLLYSDYLECLSIKKILTIFKSGNFLCLISHFSSPEPKAECELFWSRFVHCLLAL